MLELIVLLGTPVIAYFFVKKTGFKRMPSNNLSRFIVKEKKQNEALNQRTKGGIFS